ncbi:MAG: glutamate-1-semialdehyde 2,1-aminomutase [Acidobacteriota bacterium]
MKRERSREYFAEAQRYLPGGVNSPVRAFGAVGGEPVFMAQGSGAHLTDVDGNTYLDYVCSWGPLILGHAHPRVVRAISNAAIVGTSFGAPTHLETKLAQRLCEAFTSVDKVRLVNSGTEAVTSALRLARAASGRDLIVKMAGCYHGHVDSLLVAAGSGATTFGQPSSAGVPKATAAQTLLVPFNDLEAVRAVLEAHAEKVAAVILEPVAGNMGVVPPLPEYLEGVKKLCRQHGTLLVLDEIITGFRVAFGGAQERYGVAADLTCLGKVIGGGLPVGAYGGCAELLNQMSPEGPVYQAGTLSGNPLAMAAGIEQLDLLKQPGCYDKLESVSAGLEEGMRKAIAGAHVSACVQRVGSMLTFFFHPGPVRCYDDALSCDTEAFARFHARMLDAGIYLPPSQFESWFVSLAHTEADVKATVEATATALRKL